MPRVAQNTYRRHHMGNPNLGAVRATMREIAPYWGIFGNWTKLHFSHRQSINFPKIVNPIALYGRSPKSVIQPPFIIYSPVIPLSSNIVSSNFLPISAISNDMIVRLVLHHIQTRFIVARTLSHGAWQIARSTSTSKISVTEYLSVVIKMVQTESLSEALVSRYGDAKWPIPMVTLSNRLGRANGPDCWTPSLMGVSCGFSHK
jgi:hypothetical protein